MKNMKRIFSLVLALALVLGMAINVAAVQPVDVQTNGHVYNVYQIFTGTQTAADATLTDIAWGNGVNSAALLNALKADTKIGSFFADCSTAPDVAQVLATNSSNELVKNAFANIAVNFVTTPIMNGEKALEINDDTLVVDLDPGYYLFLDVTENMEQGHAYNPALLQVTKAGNITIEKKTTVPEIEKSVYDGTEQGVQHDDAMIGTKVTFQITTTLPTGLGHYSEYEYIIHDDMPKGLTYVADSVEVYLMVDGVFADKKLVADSSYTVTGADTTCEVFGTAVAPTADNGYSNNTCDLEITFKNLRQPITVDGKQVTVDANDKFFVTYKALVTPEAEEWMQNAIICLHNDAVLEFSNNPNWNPGEPDPDEPTPEPPTGITPETDAEVYLTKVIIEKVDDSKRPLTGAKFTLKREGVAMAPVVTYGERFVESTTFAADETKYWLLTDGTYTRVNPATAGVDTSVYADVTKTYKREVYTIVSETTADTPDEITVEVGETGRVSFSGLGAGIYWLTEAKAPSGYNLLEDPIKLVIDFNPETGKFTYDWRHEHAENALSATMTIQIVNTAGKILPETGGMGTTMFYVFGGIMVLAATVLLITKKRMAV